MAKNTHIPSWGVVKFEHTINATFTLCINPPTRVRVILMGLSWSLHVTTVPFNMASGVAVTLRVDVRSARGGVKVRVAVKIPRLTLRGCSVARNLTTGLNAVLLHSRLVAPPVTVHVRITSSLGQMPP